MRISGQMTFCGTNFPGCPEVFAAFAVFAVARDRLSKNKSI